MARPPSPTVRKRQLANALRRLRLNAGFTLEEAATHLETSAATLSRIENEVRVPRARDVRDLCAFYGLTDPEQVGELIALVASARESGWWEAYSEVDEQYATFIGLESASTAMQQYEGLVVPGLLQTEAYAREYLISAISPGRLHSFSETDIEKRVEIRLERQNILSSSSGLRYFAILDEAVFYRIVKSKQVMNDQIRHLLNLSDRPNVSLRMIPFATGCHPGQQGGFTILTLPHDVSDVVYLESLAGEIFIEEAHDVARHRKVFDLMGEVSLDEKDTAAAMRMLLFEEEESS